MALKAVVDNLDDVPEHFHELYTERNGKFEITGIEGMKTEADVTRIQAGLNKERDDHKRTKERFAPIASMDLNDVLAKLDKFPELEAAAAGKLDESAINNLVEGRLRTRLAPIERERDQLKSAVGERDQKIQGFETKERQRSITSAVAKAARKAGVQDTAIEDAKLLAERVFDLDESGNVTAKEGVGCTPGIDPTVWFTEMQAKRPHWWGTSQGGGGRGNGGGNTGGGSNPWTRESWNMTEQSRIYKENPTRAAQLAKSAGTTIGGLMPAAKK